MNSLRRLAVADLDELARALRSGRLSSPLSGTALQRYLPAEAAHEVAQELGALFEEGLHAAHLAWFVESLAATRREHRAVSDIVDLVTTGPEAPGVANRDTRVVVGELFATARNFVLIAGYAVYRGEEIFRTLAKRMDDAADFTVKMFLDVQRGPGDSSLPGEIVRRFAARFRSSEWSGKRLPEIYYDPRSLDIDGQKRASLHAKCIVIDREVAFVSSANFTTAAQLKNIEVGVLVRSAEIASRLAHHFEALATTGLLVRVETS